MDVYEGLSNFLAWAWARHHNILSWYIRPLFLIPFCYFAYRRSWAGIVGTLIALATSMFWFPAPANPDPQVIEFLRMEEEYLTGPWTLYKWLLTALIPTTFILLGLAFWKRSLWYGLGIINFMAIAKVVWSVVFGGESAAALLPPALIGLAICNIAIYAGIRWYTRSHPHRTAMRREAKVTVLESDTR